MRNLRGYKFNHFMLLNSESSTKTTELIALQLLQTPGVFSVFDRPEQALKRLDLAALGLNDEVKLDGEQMQGELFLKFIVAWSSLQDLGEQVKRKDKRWRLSDMGNVMRIANRPKDLVGAIVDMRKGDNRLAIRCFLSDARSLEKSAISRTDSDDEKKSLHRLALKDLQRAAVLTQDKKV